MTDVLGLVSSLSGQNNGSEDDYLFDDPNYQCDYPEFMEKIKKEIAAPTPILTKRGTLTVTGSVNIKKYIGNLSSGAQISYRSTNSSIASVNASGVVSPGTEGSTNINIKIVQNKKTYNLTLKVKSKFPKKGSKLTYQNGIYKVVKPAKKSKNKIIAGTVSFAGLEKKSVTSFTIPEKIKIGKVTYYVTHVEKNAFAGCKKLKTLTVKTTKLTKSTVGAKAFQGIHPQATIKVPKKKRSAYKTLFKSKGAGKKVKIK